MGIDYIDYEQALKIYHKTIEKKWWWNGRSTGRRWYKTYAGKHPK